MEKPEIGLLSRSDFYFLTLAVICLVPINDKFYNRKGEMQIERIGVAAEMFMVLIAGGERAGKNAKLSKVMYL